jgi:hypothetical protein
MDGRIERIVEQHDLPTRLCCAPTKIREVANNEHRSSDTLWGRAHTSAKAEHVQSLSARCHQHCRLLTALPVGHRHGFGVHGIKALCLQLADDPVDGPLEALGAAQSMTEAVDELGEACVRRTVAQRGVDQPIRVATV